MASNLFIFLIIIIIKKKINKKNTLIMSKWYTIDMDGSMNMILHSYYYVPQWQRPTVLNHFNLKKKKQYLPKVELLLFY